MRQVAHTPLPLKSKTCSSLPQKVQVLVILRRTMLGPSTEIRMWSPSRMLKSRRVSAGMTTLPRSSIFRAIPASIVLSRPGHAGAYRPLRARDVSGGPLPEGGTLALP